MARYTQEQLEALKRKDIIALCKEHEIKCVGKNSELIEKLLELLEEMEQPLEIEVALEETDKIAEKVEDEDSIEVTTNIEDTINDIAHIEEEATVELGENELKPEITDEQTDGSNESIIKEIPEPQEECPLELTVTEDKTLEPAMEQSSPQTRRLSARLSAAHVKRHVDPPKPKPKPSSLKQSSIPDSIPKHVGEQKENSRPVLFNKNISHIPTLKERVSKLSSLPSTLKRPATSTTIAKRPKYDPKESIKKPLSYKPYTGPIKKQFS